MQRPQPGKVRPVPITGFILRRLEDGGNGMQAWIRQQSSKSFFSDRAGADVGVTITVRSSLSEGVVAVHDMDVLEADDLLDLCQGGVDICGRGQRIARGVQVTGVEANTEALAAQPIEEPGQMLETSSQDGSLAGGRLQQDTGSRGGLLENGVEGCRDTI